MQANRSMPASTLSFLDECHDLVLEHLRPHIKKMFESSDLAFLEFAEKAQSNTSQHGFFEAMTVIQKNRDNVEEIFYRELGRSFADFGCSSERTNQDNEISEDPLSLVSKEDMDIQVAIQNMVSSATLGSAQELIALRQRLAVLNNGRQLEEKDIPGGPTCLANAFHLAAAGLVLEHQTRLVVYMLFNKFVLGTADQLYDDYNKHLLKAGLLPNLKYEVRIKPSKQPSKSGDKGDDPADAEASAENSGNNIARSGNNASSGNAAGCYNDNAAANSNDAGNESLGDELFGSIMQLLSRRNSQGQGNNGSSAGQSGGGSPAQQGNTGGSGPWQQGNTGGGSSPGQQRHNNGQQQAPASGPIQQTELVSALHTLQQNGAPGNPAASRKVTPVSDVRESKQLVAELVATLSAEREQLYNGVDRRRLPAADTQVIDLIGMMFEYMLNDDDIPSVAKAELSRLHTPYLKVAILDKNFFSENKHPAHELLNVLARAAARWVFENSLDRGIFPSIHNIVERVLAEFESNTDVFNELLTLFRANVRDMEIKSTAIEKRTRQAAEGKEKLGLARNYAATTIRKCIKGHSVPAPIRKLLNDVWQEKLMFIYLREPESETSDSWKLAVQTVEAIIWSVEPRTTEEALDELRDKLPEIQEQIEQAVATLHAYGSNDTEPQLALIRDIQEAILREPVSAPYPPEPGSKPGQEDTVNTATANEDISGSEDTAAATEDKLSPEVVAAMTELENLAFGTWFFIQEDEDSLPERLRLSWYSQMSGNYMFVDSMGMKAMIRKHEELAAMLVTGNARILQDEQRPLIHRALRAIRRMLGGDKSDQA